MTIALAPFQIFIFVMIDAKYLSTFTIRGRYRVLAMDATKTKKKKKTGTEKNRRKGR